MAPRFQPIKTANCKEPRDIGLWLTRSAFIFGVSLLIVGSLMPAEHMPALINDKVEHFLAYAALMVAGSQACRNRQDKLLLALFLFVLAVGLEVAQSLSPGRSTEFADAFAGWMGICLAFILLRLIRILPFR